MHAIEARLSNFRVSKLLKRRSAATVMLSRTKHLALLCNQQLRFLATLNGRLPIFFRNLLGLQDGHGPSSLDCFWSARLCYAPPVRSGPDRTGF
jgi:hypothetical protein